MKQFISKSQKIGKIGEEYACQVLKEDGYTILERNFSIREGEIDVVAKKKGTTYCIEVKTARSYSPILPSENLHIAKLGKFRKAVFGYCQEYGVPFSKVKLVGMLVYLNSHDVLVRYEYIDFVL
jgi:putative endonuclease